MVNFLRKLFNRGQPSDAPALDESAITLLGVTKNYQALKKLLNHPNPETRKQAVVAISIAAQTQLTGGGTARYGTSVSWDQRATPLLQLALKDSDPSVVAAAEEALGNKKDSN